MDDIVGDLHTAGDRRWQINTWEKLTVGRQMIGTILKPIDQKLLIFVKPDLWHPKGQVILHIGKAGHIHFNTLMA